jgi:hypothetical protein
LRVNEGAGKAREVTEGCESAKRARGHIWGKEGGRKGLEGRGRGRGDGRWAGDGVRREYLTGFRKRRQERRQKAQQDLKRHEKRLMAEARARKRAELEELARAQEEALGFSVMDIPVGRSTATAHRKAGGSSGGSSGAAAGGGARQEKAVTVVEGDAFSKAAFGAGTVVIESVEGLEALDEDDVLVSNANAVARTERRVRAKARRKQ